MIDGIINVKKEAGFTSHDVVAKLRGILKQKKIGHTGTLDPQATGVLPVCLGKGTRLCDMMTDKEKTYEAVLLLGVETDTQDLEGTVLQRKEVCCSEEEVRAAAEGFFGEQLQVPPMYSALKVNGRKLYELAREGVEVERKARRIHIYEIQITKMELPRVWLTITCSKGTYIRTICHDLGQKLGCGGAMERLVRTRVGRFRLEEALTLSQIGAAAAEGRVTELVLSVEEVLKEYPPFYCPSSYDKLVHNGNPIDVSAVTGKPVQGWLRVYDSQKNFIGIYEQRKGRSLCFPVKMFV